MACAASYRKYLSPLVLWRLPCCLHVSLMPASAVAAHFACTCPHALRSQAAAPSPSAAALTPLLSRLTSFAAPPCSLPPPPQTHTGLALFEAITHLPCYYLTAAEEEILAARANELLQRCLPPGGEVVVELGVG